MVVAVEVKEMKNLRLLFTISFVLVFVFSIGLPAANSDTFTFSPSPSNLGDLDHSNSYTWGIEWNLPSGQIITQATLTYENIYDLAEEPNHLYTYLLNTVTDPNGPKKPPNWINKGTYSTITIIGTDHEWGHDIRPDREWWHDKSAGVLFLGRWSDPRG